MIDGEIRIDFPKPVSGIILISSTDIKAHFDRLRVNVPFTYVGLPYVEIAGESYAVLPLPEMDEEKMRKFMEQQQ